MRFRAVLLSSVTVIAVSAGPVWAQTAPSPTDRFPSWYFSAEGGAITAKPTVSTDKVGTGGYSPQLGDDYGGYGAFSFGHTIESDHDWRVGLAYSRFQDNFATTDTSQVQVATVGSELGFGTADFEFGTHPVVPAGMDLRFFAGLRALTESESVSADKVGSPYYSSIDSHFGGIGPRIGADFHGQKADSPWGISSAISAAAIFGERHSSGFAGTTNASEDVSRTAYNVEGSFGIDYHASPATTFTFGVRAQQWWNLRLESTNSDLEVNPNVLDWGPFVKATWRAP